MMSAVYWRSRKTQRLCRRNDRPSDDAEGTKRLQSLCRMTEPKFYRPTSAEGDKSSDRKAKEGCEIVFTIPKDRDVASRFSSAGAYDGAKGLGTFTEVDDAMKDHLKDPLGCTEKRAFMKREWTYRDSSGTEYGPYTWQELVTYGPGRSNRSGRRRSSGHRTLAVSRRRRGL